MSGERVAIAERWSVLRRGIVGLLDGPYEVVADVEDPTQLRVADVERLELAIVGADVGADLCAVVRGLLVARAELAVVVLTDDLGVDALRDVLRAGARAVLSKKVDDHALLDGLERVLRGDRVIDQTYLPLLFGTTTLDQVASDDGSPLTRRERDVLAQLARGATNREIAESLLVGEATVKTHLGRIYAKLEVSGRHHAVGRALELGLLG